MTLFVRIKKTIIWTSLWRRVFVGRFVPWKQFSGWKRFSYRAISLCFAGRATDSTRAVDSSHPGVQWRLDCVSAEGTQARTCLTYPQTDAGTGRHRWEYSTTVSRRKAMRALKTKWNSLSSLSCTVHVGVGLGAFHSCIINNNEGRPCGLHQILICNSVLAIMKTVTVKQLSVLTAVHRQHKTVGIV